MGSMMTAIPSMFLDLNQTGLEEQRNKEQYSMDVDAANFGILRSQEMAAREEGAIRKAGTQLQEAQKVAYVNAGVDPTVGSAANVQADTAGQTELDAQTAKNNAALEAWGFKQQKKQAALNFRARDAARENKFWGSFVSNAGNYLGGAMTLGSKL